MDDAAVYSANAEFAIIGAAFMDAESIDRCASIVKADDFTDPQRAAAWESLVAAADAGRPISTVSLAYEVARRCPGSSGVDLHPWVIEIANNTLTSKNIEHHARVVAAYAQLRRVADVGRRLVARAERADFRDVSEVIGESLAAMFALEGAGSDARASTLNVLQKAKIDMARARASGTYVEPPRVLTGLHELDGIVRILPGRMYLIGAETGHGKTALAVHMALAAANAGSVLYVTTEDPDEAIATRSLGSMGNMDMKTIDHGLMTDDNVYRLINRLTQDRNKCSRFHVYDAPTTTCSDIDRQIRRVKRTAPKDAPLMTVFVDYLQLVQAEGRCGTRELEVAEVADGLKTMAKRHDVAVVTMSQLNRANSARPDKRPVVSDIRESAKPAQNAAAVFFIYRPGMYDETAGSTECELIVRKNRGGRLSTAHCTYDPSTNHFANKAQDEIR